MTLLTLATVSSTQTSGTQLRRDSRLSKYPLQIHQMYRDQILRKPSKPMGEWSDWDSWSPCSRSCGGGITQQTRHCVNRPAESRLIKRRRGRRQSVRPIGGCVGLYKRVRLCNDKECPSRTDFRHEQCAAFNAKTFRGAIHQWEPFLKVKDECALNCRAVGMNFFATLNKTVIDGTPCLYPVTHTGKAAPRGTRGVCVGGYCKVGGILVHIEKGQVG
ncbi:unnamed protein product [Acanthoscelides obtectus]|uniref:Uncharacterized protein n=1 Tax=Acanthoscelides obtectus TaxID=200917 RepID=A0A9P0LBS0_ACAOB|nr:unnamed protein product [Acanthoscelides obtectus]CAK1641818.1 A disintegrin and metalloproteinase with thrombospondin motifs 16 [Acanthoscelides obtectus]